MAYMADGTAHYAEKVGDTQQPNSCSSTLKFFTIWWYNSYEQILDINLIWLCKNDIITQYFKYFHIGLHINAHKTEYMCYNQTGDISTLDGTSLKTVDKFTYVGRSVSSTEKDIDTWITKA